MPLPWTNLGQPQPGGYAGQAQNIIQQGQAQGLFNPMGSPQINAAVRAGALRNAVNARRRAGILSRLMGLDPNQARAAFVGADTASSGATQEALNNANLQQLLGGQQFARWLFGGQLQNEQSLANQMRLLKYQQQLSNPGFGAFAGQALGYALPGIGGALFRRQPQQSPYGNYTSVPQYSYGPYDQLGP